MVNTQKLTAMAFAYYDGLRSEHDLSKDQQKQVIRLENTILYE
jgi:hypothetical protein